MDQIKVFKVQKVDSKGLGGLRRRETREGGRTNATSLGQGKAAIDFKSRLSAVICGAEFNAEIRGTELDAVIYGAEICAT
jgi:hypothetical protein